MKYVSVLKNNNINNFLKLLTKNKLSMFIWFCLLVSMVLGTVSITYFNTELLYKVNFLFTNDFKIRATQSWKEIFLSSFFSLNIFVFSTELCMLSCFGIVLIPLIIIVRGYSLGLSAGYLYLTYKLKGIAFYILILLPGIIMSSIGYSKFAVEAIKFSYNFFKLIFSKHDFEYNFKLNMKQNAKKAGNCLIIMVLASVLDVCFMLLFSNFFDF